MATVGEIIAFAEIGVIERRVAVPVLASPLTTPLLPVVGTGAVVAAVVVVWPARVRVCVDGRGDGINCLSFGQNFLSLKLRKLILFDTN